MKKESRHWRGNLRPATDCWLDMSHCMLIAFPSLAHARISAIPSVVQCNPVRHRHHNETSHTMFSGICFLQSQSHTGVFRILHLCISTFHESAFWRHNERVNFSLDITFNVVNFCYSIFLTFANFCIIPFLLEKHFFLLERRFLLVKGLPDAGGFDAPFAGACAALPPAPAAARKAGAEHSRPSQAVCFGTPARRDTRASALPCGGAGPAVRVAATASGGVDGSGPRGWPKGRPQRRIRKNRRG